MITRFGNAPRLPGMSPAEFNAHWRTSHADVVRRLPGLRRYEQDHPLLVNGRPIFPYPGFDAASELDFDSVETMEEAFESHAYHNAVANDEQVFVDKERFSLVVARRRMLADGTARPVKLISFLRTHPASTDEALIDAVAGPFAEEARKGGVGHHELYLPVVEAHRRVPAACDAIDVLFFFDAPELMAFLNSDQWQRANWELSGRAFGVEHLAAEAVRVV